MTGVSGQQRLRALLFHQGLAAGVRLSSAAERAQLAGQLSPAGGQLLSVGGRAIAHLDGELELLDGQLRSFAGRQPGCRALTAQLYGVGALTATALLAELGDTRRFARSDDAVRYAGLDITVGQSDHGGAPGHLSRQGPQLLRWARYRGCRIGRPPPAHPTTPTTCKHAPAWATNAPAWPWPANCYAAPTTCCANWAMPASRPPAGYSAAQAA